MARKRKTLLILELLCCYFLIDLSSATERDTIFAGQELSDWQHLASLNKLFRLKFFSPSTTKSRYLGIFYILLQNAGHYQDEERPVWVANRDSPILDTSGSLQIDVDGRLKIFYDGGDAIVLSSAQAKGNASITLLDNGNLVLRELNSDGSVNQILWQSFDYPSDTLLPGMKLGVNFKTGHRWSLTSWASQEVPASGSFTFGGDPNGTSRLMIWWHGNVKWTSGNWSNGRFDNVERFSYYYLNFTYISNEDEEYLTYSANSGYRLSRYTIDSSGVIKDENGPVPFGQCTSSIIATDAGCVKETLPPCRTDDLFKGDLWVEQRQGFFYGDSFRFYENESFSLFDCGEKCKHDCSCEAYASIFDNGTGCEIWTSLKFETTDTTPSREIFVLRRRQANRWWVWLIVAVAISIFPVLWCLCLGAQRMIRAEDKAKKAEKQLLYELRGAATSPHRYNKANFGKDNKISDEVQLFSFESIELGTNNFSESNKLGQGGFGQVYKGNILGGREVAIKRLSRSSGQGVQEFKNEIALIAKLQHTNLVRLLGCCIEGEEKILVYEYMTNKSLDFFLFDCSKRQLLEWSNRFNIIEGVAQGLLYLHKYSRLRVIHRDLKASNILLDNNMNPKISDFGMARIFSAQESEENTNRIVGTYGYMSPEYATSGIVSVKTDVFSFGVLTLEIVSGKKNNRSYNSARPLNLIGLAWELWREGKALELKDSALDDTSPEDEVMRCIQVGLLCVQDQAMDRPSMAEVVSMLTSDNLQSPAPKQPAFFIDIVAREPEKDERTEKFSTNDLSISEMEPR